MNGRQGLPHGLAIALAVTFLLTACQASRPTDPRPVTTVGAVEHPVPRAAPAPAVADPASLPDPQPDAEAVLRQRLAAVGLDPIEDAADLVGHSAAQVEALLGAPDLARREEPAEMWQYAGERCVLNLFLYPREGGRRTVDHAELRSRDPATTAASRPCLKEIIVSRIISAG